MANRFGDEQHAPVGVNRFGDSAHSPAPDDQSWADKIGVINPFARAGVDAVEGAASKLASTVFNGGDAIRRAVGMDRVINRPEVQQAMKTPDSPAGSIGAFAEQAAEYAIPSGIASTVVKGAPLAARLAAQALTSGAVGAAQSGGDPLATGTAAVLGGAGEAAGAALDSGKVGQLLRESAEKGYGQVLGATKQGNKWISQNVAVPELLDRGVSAMTLKGLKAKATNAVQGVGSAIDQAWAQLPPGTTSELDPIWNAISSDAKDTFTIANSNGSRIPVTQQAEHALKGIDSLKRTLLDVAEQNPTTGKLEVPAEKLRQLRQAWDEVAAQSKVFQGADLADAATGKIHAMGSDAIRNQLAQDHPDIAALNKEFYFWRNVEKVVGDTVLRRVGQSKALGEQIAGAAGAAVGAVNGGIHGAILGKTALESLTTAFRSTSWKTVSAVQKARLAQALAKGNRTGAQNAVQTIVKSMGLEAATQATE